MMLIMIQDSRDPENIFLEQARLHIRDYRDQHTPFNRPIWICRRWDLGTFD